MGLIALPMGACHARHTRSGLTHTHENLLLRTRDEKQVAIETRLECQII